MKQGLKSEHARDERSGEEHTEDQRNYSGYQAGGALEFDPTKDLNLPESYDEVVKRFNRLQGDRAMEALN